MSEICCLCDTEYLGCGNNASPLKEGGCCDACYSKVLERRLDNTGIMITTALCDLLTATDENRLRCRKWHDLSSDLNKRITGNSLIRDSLICVEANLMSWSTLSNQIVTSLKQLNKIIRTSTPLDPASL